MASVCVMGTVEPAVLLVSTPSRMVDAALEDQHNDHYQLPIRRDAIYLLASAEDLAQHEAELLQVGSCLCFMPAAPPEMAPDNRGWL